MSKIRNYNSTPNMEYCMPPPAYWMILLFPAYFISPWSWTSIIWPRMLFVYLRS